MQLSLSVIIQLNQGYWFSKVDLVVCRKEKCADEGVVHLFFFLSARNVTFLCAQTAIVVLRT